MTDQTSLSFVLAESWGRLADEQYKIYRAFTEAPALFKSHVPFETRIEFEYAREWYDFWAQQFKLDSTATGAVE